MALAKIVLHVRTVGDTNLTEVDAFIRQAIGEHATAPRSVALPAQVIDIKPAEWVTDWDTETDDDQPINIEWKDDPTDTPEKN